MAPLDDLPPGEAEGIPIAQAFHQYAMECLFKERGCTRMDIRAGLRLHFFGSPGGIEDFVLRGFRGDDDETRREVRQLNFDIETGFIRKFRCAELASRGRDASLPFEAPREIHPSLWLVCWPSNLHKGIIKGLAGVELFDVHVGPRAPRAPEATGAPGRPTNMPLVETIFYRRMRAGDTKPDLNGEARDLSDAFKAGHPDMVSPTSKTIANRLRDPYRTFQEILKRIPPK